MDTIKQINVGGTRPTRPRRSTEEARRCKNGHAPSLGKVGVPVTWRSAERPKSPPLRPVSCGQRPVVCGLFALIKGEKNMAYLYTPAFVAYCGGTPDEEIAAEFKIPLKSLQAKMRQEGWRALANRMAGRFNPDVNPSEETLNRIEANRARNFEAAAKLREHLFEIIAALGAGTLRIKKQFQRKGQIIEYDVLPGPGDWLNIATYARTIADMTYRALGDHAANGGYKADASAGNPPPAPPITIVLPNAISRPRDERSLEIESAVVEQANQENPLPLALRPPEDRC